MSEVKRRRVNARELHPVITSLMFPGLVRKHDMSQVKINLATSILVLLLSGKGSNRTADDKSK